MKKLILWVAIVLFANAALAYQIEENNVTFEAGGNYSMQDKAATTSFLVPNVAYEFEAKPNKMFKVILNSNVSFDMFKNTLDGDALPGMDTWGNNLGFNLSPAVKAYFPNDLFAKVVLPYNFTHATPQVEDNASDLAETTNALNADVSFGYDPSKGDIELLSPWADFSEGLCVEGKFGMEIYSKTTVDGEGDAVEDHDMHIGAEASYAILKKDMNMNIKPMVAFEKHLNDEVTEAMAIDLGLYYAQDFSKVFALDATLGMNMFKLNSDEDMVNTLGLEVAGHYYPMEELEIVPGFGFSQDLTTDDADPVMTFSLGASYNLDLK